MPAFILNMGMAVWLANGLPATPHDVARAASTAAKDQATVDRALAAWEKKTSAAKTFKCNFTRLRYDSVFNSPKPGQDEEPNEIAKGEFIWAAPSNAVARESQLRRKITNPHSNELEWHGVGEGDFNAFDGTTLSFVDRDSRCVRCIKADADDSVKFCILWACNSINPLEFVLCPFGFRVSAADLKSRFTIRNVMPGNAGKETWLEMTPRDPKKSLFAKITVILGPDAIPTAVELTNTATERTVILFEKPQFDPPQPLAADTFAPHPDGYKVIGP